ncbi:hypothetical protein AC579_6591 [Pseudocercospora musae]|uniref:Caffeine-induced death protein Cid2 n=1 Tax=Pseudocercospora musae TaxID=113226 RepID=A0A139IGF9_9PEZI|nr:hypothetical protein AC579_6591 [Pseudocercospora musae]
MPVMRRVKYVSLLPRLGSADAFPRSDLFFLSLPWPHPSPSQSCLPRRSSLDSQRSSASTKLHSEVQPLSTLDFLRLSRTAIDDTINQHLNALATPASTSFDPATTAERQPTPIGRRQLPQQGCQTFRDKILFPSWQARSDVLNYCAGVATSPDPDDPDHVLRESEDARARERLVDERLDPYSASYFPRHTRTGSLAGLIRNERMVENIIRARTWTLMGERCENETQNSDQALNEWRRRNDTTAEVTPVQAATTAGLGQNR